MDARASVWFNFLFFLPLLLLVRGRTSEPGKGVVDKGLSHSILPRRGGMTGQSAPAVIARSLVTLNDGEGVELLLAAWLISGGSRRGVT